MDKLMTKAVADATGVMDDTAEIFINRLAEAGYAVVPAAELSILRDILNQARCTLLVGIKAPEDLNKSLGNLNLICKKHWDWQTETLSAAALVGREP